MINKGVKLLAVLAAMNIGCAFAASNDSTSVAPNPGGVSVPPRSNLYNSNFNVGGISSTSQTTYTYAQCPSGFSYDGSNMYPIKQQTTITYYRNGQVVGKQAMPPQDTDADCSKVEVQNVACPIGYTGTITQQRLVSTGNNGYEYSPWSTTNNTCVPVPVLQCTWNSSFRNPSINVGQTYTVDNPVYAMYGTISDNPFGSTFLPGIYDFHAVDILTPAATNDPGLHWVELLDSFTATTHQWKWALVGTPQQPGTYQGFYRASCGDPIGDNSYYQYTVN